MEPTDFAFCSFELDQWFFKTWPNRDTLGTLLKTQIPRSCFKSTDLEITRNGAQESIPLQSLPGTLKKTVAEFPARPIKSELMEVMPQNPALKKLSLPLPPAPMTLIWNQGGKPLLQIFLGP